jgi:7-carboxy-7-deazaguanine synthase
VQEAKISEIFLSQQGEGPFWGSKQLFIRFYGCNLECVYCDTLLVSYKTFTRDMLLGKILDFEDDYNELALTGGEPLLHGDFLKEFLPLFRKHRKHRVFLETNGTMPEALKEIIDLVDIVSMDVKLPSSGGTLLGVWGEHRKFMEVSRDKELIVKAVVADSTTFDDIKELGRIVSGIDKELVVVLQPVTPVNEHVKEPDDELLSYFRGYLENETDKKVMVLAQMHKCMGIK